MTDQPSGKLRVGLLLNGLEIPAWQHVMLERIKNSDYAAIELVVLNDSPRSRPGFASRLARNRAALVYLAHRWLENKFFKPSPNAFENRNAAALLAGIPTLEVQPRQTRYADFFPDDAIEAIGQYRLDVLIRLGFRILKGRILEAARFGVWSYHHGDGDINRGGPAGFWEVLKGHPVTGSLLQQLTSDLDNGVVLCKSYSRTDYLSVNRNRNRYYWKTLAFVPRKLKELHESGGERFVRNARSANERLHFYSRPLYTRPGNGELLGLLGRHLLRFARKRARDLLFRGQWVLMFDIRSDLSTSFWRFRQIVPPKDRFWADPHVIYREGRYYIFIEEYPYARRKGHIALLVMDEQGRYTEPVTILDLPYHLSYPFVFEFQGDLYMIPESAAHRTIDVYRCTEFPHRWEFHKTLMTGVSARDTTLFLRDGTCWLFTSKAENEGASWEDELFLFSAENPLTTQWRPHPRNPIVSDVSRARPAGRIFEHAGKIYRPSQNCSKGGGYGMKINEITKLSQDEYEEKEIDSIEPDWDRKLTGVHTLAFEKNLTLIDARFKRFRL